MRSDLRPSLAVMRNMGDRIAHLKVLIADGDYHPAAERVAEALLRDAGARRALGLDDRGIPLPRAIAVARPPRSRH